MIPFETLYPECPTCGAREGIHKAIVGPTAPDGFHDVERYILACGHEMRPEVRIEDGVVDLFQMQHPDLIELTGGGA